MTATDVRSNIKQVKKELFEAHDIMNEKVGKLLITTHELSGKVSFVQNLNKTFETMRQAVQQSHFKVM